MTNKVATVICRQRGFMYGVFVLNHSYGNTTGPVWISRAYCNGNESSILECELVGLGEKPDTACANHEKDIGVKCYASGTYIFTHFSFICFPLDFVTFISKFCK